MNFRDFLRSDDEINVNHEDSSVDSSIDSDCETTDSDCETELDEDEPPSNKESNIEEKSPYEELKIKVSKSIWANNYKLALAFMKKNKVKASVAARIFPHVDAKELQRMMELNYEF